MTATPTQVYCTSVVPHDDFDSQINEPNISQLTACNFQLKLILCSVCDGKSDIT